MFYLLMSQLHHNMNCFHENREKYRVNSVLYDSKKILQSYIGITSSLSKTFGYRIITLV